MTYEDAQRAYDNEEPEDYAWHPLTDDEKGEMAENEANRRAEREER